MKSRSFLSKVRRGVLTGIGLTILAMGPSAWAQSNNRTSNTDDPDRNASDIDKSTDDDQVDSSTQSQSQKSKTKQDQSSQSSSQSDQQKRDQQKRDQQQRDQQAQQQRGQSSSNQNNNQQHSQQQQPSQHQQQQGNSSQPTFDQNQRPYGQQQTFNAYSASSQSPNDQPQHWSNNSQSGQQPQWQQQPNGQQAQNWQPSQGQNNQGQNNQQQFGQNQNWQSQGQQDSNSQQRQFSQQPNQFAGQPPFNGQNQFNDPNQYNGQQNQGQNDPNQQQGQNGQNNGEQPPLGITLAAHPTHGVQVIEVSSNSPAAHAGLQQGDQIVAVNGQHIHSNQDLMRSIHESAQRQQGPVALTVLRNGQTGTVYAMLTPHGPTQGTQHWSTSQGAGGMHRERPALGVILQQQGNDVHITNVLPNSPAQRAGLQPGDQIVAVGQQRVSSEHDVMNLVAQSHPDERLPIEVNRNGQFGTIWTTPEQSGEVFNQQGANR